MNANDLKAGFTGEVQDAKDGISTQAKTAARYVSREANAVVTHAQDHPSGTGAALMIVGAAAFLAGYLLGSAPSSSSHRRYW